MYHISSTHQPINRTPIISLLIVYGLLVIWLTFFYSGQGERLQYDVSTYNFVPFHNISHFYQNYAMHGWSVRRSFLFNVFGNLLLLLPPGLFSFMLLPSRRRLSLSVKLAILLPFIIECLQALSRRGVWDIDDIILNATGFLLGTLFAFLSQKFLTASKAKSPG